MSGKKFTQREKGSYINIQLEEEEGGRMEGWREGGMEGGREEEGKEE